MVESVKYVGFMFPQKRSEAGIPSRATGMDLFAGNLRQLLMTEPGERAMMPEYGTALRRFVFEQGGVTHQVAADVERIVRESIAVWEPRVSVDSVNVGNSAEDEHAIHVSVDFALRDDPQSQTSVSVEVSS